ncbi:MAG: gas vesicle protein, partial [Rhodococcus sp. (in: high G+C Gram-positive bacteria)]|nr:gas vesicle protein [Rhodococcus sp. (in: high G+C Gram-positive bacteria)]
IDWWESDPWLSSKARNRELHREDDKLELENLRLRERIAELESGQGRREAVESARVEEEDRD